MDPRVTKVVKGGKNLSFQALVVIGSPYRESGGLRPPPPL